MGKQEFLYAAPFDDDWDPRGRSLLWSGATDRGLRPLVLLPDDIQVEEYEPYFEVVHGMKSISALEGPLAPGSPPRLLFCDLAPAVGTVGHDFLAAVKDTLRMDDLNGSVLVIYSPAAGPFLDEDFDVVKGVGSALARPREHKRAELAAAH